MIIKNFDPLTVVAISELVVLGVCVLVTTANAIRQQRLTNRQPEQLASLQAIVQRFFDSETLNNEDRNYLRHVPMQRRIELLARLSSMFQGSEGQSLYPFATQLGIIRLASRRCKSKRWARRLEGIRLFALCGEGDEQVPPLLYDRREEVRAGAAAWAARHPRRDIIAHLLSLLGDNSTFCRFTVKDSLLRLGPAITSELANYLAITDSPSEESLEVAAWTADAEFLPVGIRLLHHPSPRIRSRAITLLSALGGEEATRAVIAAIKDDSAEVRIAALRSIARLGYWQAAPVASRAMSDAEWNVRKQAGLTLRSLRGPGILLLRQCQHSDDRFVADMARHILDMPSTAISRVS